MKSNSRKLVMAAAAVIVIVGLAAVAGDATAGVTFEKPSKDLFTTVVTTAGIGGNVCSPITSEGGGLQCTLVGTAFGPRGQILCDYACTGTPSAPSTTIILGGGKR